MRIGDLYWELPTSFPSLSISSIYFVAFAVIVFILSRTFKSFFRPIVLFAANILFLWSFSKDFYYLIVIGFSALVSYLLGLCLDKDKNKGILIFGVLIYVLTLLFFKYNGLLKFDNVIAPLGLSFYTFKIISYLVDVYKGKMEACKNILYYFDYVMFFPCITAGPINRAKPFIDEIRKPREFDYKEAKNGGIQMVVGIFEKIVFADFLGDIATRILDNVELKGIIIVVAIIAYSFQIYLDFDACSNIAIGCAKLLGFNLDKNFNSPYISKNLKEFWRRWHISLSSFFKDYIYIPLGGSRKGTLRTYINILVVFIVSGLWHGNTLNFLIWGLLHGLVSIIENIIEKPFSKIKINKFIKVIINFFRIIINFVIVTSLWLVFRYNTMQEVFEVIHRMFETMPIDLEVIGMTLNEFRWLGVIILITIVVDIIRNYIDPLMFLAKWPFIFRWAFYIALIAIYLVFGMYGGSLNPNDFIYQFF